MFWPVFALVLLLGLHRAASTCATEVPPAREPRAARNGSTTLTRTRRQALEAQAAELRRIERDLHDGAQARLVALSMQLGRAEASSPTRPRRPSWCAGPRRGAARRSPSCATSPAGIAPPVLADRGLVGGRRSPWPTAARRPDRRPDPRTAGRPPVGRDRGLLRGRRGADQRDQARPGRGCPGRLALDPDTLVVERDRRRPGRGRPAGSGLDRPAPPGRGTRRDASCSRRRRADRPTCTWSCHASRHRRGPRPAARGVRRPARARRASTSSATEDAGPGLLRIVAEHKPDLAIVDVRLPPDVHRRGHPGRDRCPRGASRPGDADPVAVRRAGLHGRAAGLDPAAGSATCSRSGSATSRDFVDALRRVAAGGTALDREVVTELVRTELEHRRSARRADAARARDARR